MARVRPASRIAAVVLGLVAVVHGVRLVMGTEVIIDGRLVPSWASLLVALVAAGLAVALWRESRTGA